MTTRTILVLANSIKYYPGRCIAGREVAMQGGRYRLGRWVRPVTNHSHGELSPGEATCTDGGQPAVGDIVRVPASEPAADPLQPENWFIAPGERWTKIAGRQHEAVRGQLEERPDDLWLEEGLETDRMRHETLLARPPACSIQIIRPKELRVAFWTEHSEYDGKDHRKHRARFWYRAMPYDLSLTDPVASSVFGRRCPKLGEEPIVVPISGRYDPLICVSLAPDFNGFHYKVVATVLV